MATDSSTNQNIINILFTQSTITMIIWFLGIYFVCYLLFGLFMPSEDSASKIHRMLDIIVFGILILWVLILFYNVSQTNADITQIIKANISNLFSDPYTIIHSVVFIVLFNVLLFLFRIPLSGASSPYFVSLVMGGAWIVLVISMITWFFNKFLNVSLFDSSLWNDLTSNQPTINGNVVVNGNVHANYNIYDSHDEVFNISNNLYTYENAKAVCSAYGARLATYDEVEQAYNKGGEWCNYGWSEDQMALFPTQKLTWFKLQRNPAHKNDCGRPGVNGGFMENPYIHFGVNCYGKKPQPSEKDKREMEANKELNVPKTPEELLLEKKVSFWKENADKLLNVNSFNYNQWSEY
jgi:hypothetical protein